ncbi:hypothetical protein KJ652_04185 [Patescibacteria group bacterium]|nr:hypothetical protein [Patescibacteria group bacterium]MBU1123765.1 hypothetical protein [Patescibacteria group bacterium]
MKLCGLSKFVALTSKDGGLRDVPNEDLPFKIDDLPKFVEKTHVESRRIKCAQETVESLSVRVLNKLYDSVRIDPKDAGGMVLVTCHTGTGKDAALSIAKECGIGGKVYPIDRACSGLPRGLDIASRIAQQTHKHVPVVITEVMSDLINWETPGGGGITGMSGKDDTRARGKASKIFGDGAGAVIVKPPGHSAEFDLLDAFTTDVDDPKGHLVLIPVEDSIAFDESVRSGISHCINMPGKSGYSLLRLGPMLMVQSMTESLRRAYECQLITHDRKPTHVVHHQANGGMIVGMESQIELQLPDSSIRIHNCIRNIGNVSAASIPTAMSMVQDELEPHSLIAMPTVGAGSPGFRKNALTRGCILVVKRGEDEREQAEKES